jgi:hypothetical protein
VTPHKAPLRFTGVEDARRRYGDRVDRLVPYFWKLDPAADAAVEALAEIGPGRSAPIVDRVLAGDPKAEREAPVALRELVEAARVVPPWLDWERANRGGALLLRAGVLGGIVLGARALVYGYAAPAGNKVLTLSGRLNEMALRRLNETGRFVQATARRDGMRPGNEGWAITLKVRLMHAQVRRMVLASGRWMPELWGAPINQHDMVATTLLFSWVTITGLRTLGLSIDREEADDYMHLWRWIGVVIGVEPELLPSTEREGNDLAQMIRATQGPPDEDSRRLVDALMRAGEREGTPIERARARRMRPVAYGLCRALVGDELADALGVPRTRWVHAAQAMRRAVAAVEVARRRSGRLERAFVEIGERYWDAVTTRGLGGATAEFGLPDRLMGAAMEAVH